MHTKSLLALAIACFLGLSAWTASGPASIAAELEPVEFDHLAPQQFALVAESRIDGEFTGWSGETAYRLLNGQVWVQASYRYRYSYSYSPSALVFYSDAHRLYLMVVNEDYRNPVPVIPATHALTSCVSGSFEGWSGETIFPLCNGQIWMQASYAYTYHYAYRPDVLIYSTDSEGTYRMKVEGVSDTLPVVRLR